MKFCATFFKLSQLNTIFLRLVVVLWAAGLQAFSQPVVVYFDTGSHMLQLEQIQKLDSASSYFKQQPKDSLFISCHCDIRADSAFNYHLSVRRAKSVASHLKKLGLENPMRLVAAGEQNPDFPNDESVRFKNRRCQIAMKKSVPNVQSITQTKVEDWQKGMLLRLDSLEFVGNQAVPNYYSMPVLYRLLQLMRQHPDLDINIHGHVCCSNNMPLSIARARAVYGYLLLNGIDTARLRYRGFSNSQPAVNEVDEAMEQRNRRVEIMIQQAPKVIIDTIIPKTAAEYQVPLLDIPWRAQTSALMPGAVYNLDLLVEMLRQSSGYYYELYVYGPNRALAQKRFQILNNYFLRQNISAKVLKVKPGKAREFLNKEVLILTVNQQVN